MRFLVDQNVDDRVAQFLQERGHEVYLVREILAPDSPDQLIAFLAEREAFVIVTHDSHFRNLFTLFPVGHRAQTASRAGRIHLNVRESRALERMTQHIEAIEFHHRQAQIGGHRLLIRITTKSFTVEEQDAG